MQEHQVVKSTGPMASEIVELKTAKAGLNQILNLLSQSVKIENRAQDSFSNLLGYSLCSSAMILKN